MAKSDLLKEAIADAKAVKETALANAKIALQEAFAPRIQNMLSAKLSEDLDEAEHDDMDDMGDAGMDVDGMDDMGADTLDAPEAEEGNVISKDELVDAIAPVLGVEEDALSTLVDAGESVDDSSDEMSDEDADSEYNEEGEDLGLDEIIAELEETMMDDDYDAEEGGHMPSEARQSKMMSAGHTDDHDTEEAYTMESIDEIINEILSEEEEEEAPVEEGTKTPFEAEEQIGENSEDLQETLEALEESYKTVKHLKSVINEVNLLNAKLLYTNKLFRNFELSEAQKMKVIENFDRASTTRETKLVFTTLAESFTKPAKKRVVKESYASRPSATTAPSKETTQILSEGFEYANRWKKLAGLI